MPLPQAAPTRAVLKTIPEGVPGVIATLKDMRQYARDAVRSPSQLIRRCALSLIQGLPERRWFAEICAVHAFVRDQIRYTHDPDGVELVQSPEKTLEFGQGDCDDKVTLLGALLVSIGHPSAFLALGFNGGPFEHVMLETRLRDKWIPLECIPWVDGSHKRAGWLPPGITSRYEMKI